MSGKGRQPLFADLVFSEEGLPVQISSVGGIPHYVVPDGDFLRHVEVEYIDRQIVAMFRERFQSMRDVIADGVAQMLGQEDLFARASVLHAIDHIDEFFESDQIDVDQLRTTLWMLKFRAVVDVHGDVVRLDVPGWELDEGD
ncbi:MAG: hypothetical protein GX620_18485 [Chloroflexi bacterium]|nr:hypothetical protein [Chloroflexota bacterium]